MGPSSSELLGPRDLAFDADPERALACLADYAPDDDEQRQTRDAIVRWVLEQPTPFERANLAGHLTASALLVTPDGRALLTHHRKLGRWLQLGGHCDGDANLAHVALREAIEESGIEELAIDPRIVDVDIHRIPARPATQARAEEPAHDHLDCRFVVYAPEGAVERISDESLALGWFAIDEALRLDLDRSLVRLFHTVLGDRRQRGA